MNIGILRILFDEIRSYVDFLEEVDLGTSFSSERGHLDNFERIISLFEAKPSEVSATRFDGIVKDAVRMRDRLLQLERDFHGSKRLRSRLGQRIQRLSHRYRSTPSRLQRDYLSLARSEPDIRKVRKAFRVLEEVLQKMEHRTSLDRVKGGVSIGSALGRKAVGKRQAKEAEARINETFAPPPPPKRYKKNRRVNQGPKKGPVGQKADKSGGHGTSRKSLRKQRKRAMREGRAARA